MRRLLGLVLLVTLLLTGCGSAASDVASDPASSASPSPTKPTAVAVGDFVTVALVSQTAAGGQVSPAAVRLDDATARGAFVSQFEKRGLDQKIDQAIAAATYPSGYALMGAVVAVGCDVPPGVDVTTSPDGYVITAQEVDKPLQECFAPVTTVAIVAVPA